MIKHLLIIILIHSLTSCSESDTTLEQITSKTVEFEKQKVSSKYFSIMIPKDWTWKHEDYGVEHVLHAIDAGSPPDPDGYIDLISILKLKSLTNSIDLESEFKSVSKEIQSRPKGSRIVESGITDCLNYNSYFVHYKSDTGTYGETESIIFILESEENGVFYHLHAGASQTKELKKNLSILVQSLKSFKMKS